MKFEKARWAPLSKHLSLIQSSCSNNDDDDDEKKMMTMMRKFDKYYFSVKCILKSSPITLITFQSLNHPEPKEI